MLLMIFKRYLLLNAFTEVLLLDLLLVEYFDRNLFSGLLILRLLHSIMTDIIKLPYIASNLIEMIAILNDLRHSTKYDD